MEKLLIDNPQKACLDIENKINDTIKPKPDYYMNINKNTNVITLTVEEGIFKPYLYKGKAYRRRGTSTVEVDQIELKRLVLYGNNLYFEELPIDYLDLTFDYLLSTLIKKLNVTGPSIDLLKTLGLLRADGKYNNAALLLADQNNFPGIDIIKFGPSINDIVERKTLDGISILEQLDRAEEMFKRYYRFEKIDGMVRMERYLIPFEAEKR